MTAFYEWLSEVSLWWWPGFADHLWQTSLFVLVVAVAAFTLRRAPARLRHNFWLLASAKFIVPAVFFVFLAQQAGIESLPIFHSTPAAEQSAILVTGVTEPMSSIAPDYEVTVIANATNDHREVYFALTAVWLAGCMALVSVWAIHRRRFLRSLKLGHRVETGREWQALERAKKSLHLQANVGLVISPLKIEPAAWRVLRPVVVMPESIANQLDDEELDAIMLHELAHIQRRDNLIGNLQLAICALLWFHPLLWFISRKLFDEREQACDERVMEVCHTPEVYASSILKVVRFSFGWKVAGVTGAASGSNLRRRIENIMTIEHTKRGTGAGPGLFASALVGIALLVLVAAGVYSKAQGRNAIASDAHVAAVETTPVAEAQLTYNDGDMPGSPVQKAKTAPPVPPTPPEPPQPDQPLQLSQTPASPPQPPNPVQVPQPAQAPQPSQAPNPASVPKPAQAPQPPPVPEPWPGQQPSHPVPSSVGAGKSGVTSFGRGVATGGAIAPARASGTGATVAPARGIGRGATVAGGRGVGGGASIAPARGVGAAAVAGGRGVGTGASIAPARGVGAASIAGGRGVGNGVSIAGGRGIATGVGGSAPSIAPARIAPVAPSAAPASRPLPAKQEKARP